jgi:hypothetical protein
MMSVTTISVMRPWGVRAAPGRDPQVRAGIALRCSGGCVVPAPHGRPFQVCAVGLGICHLCRAP